MNYSITQYLLLGAVALVYVGVITGPMRKIAIRYNAVDSPDMARKIQKEPVPYLGGVAIAVGVVVTSYIALVAKDFNLKSIGLASSVLVPAILISAMGLWDDLRGLQPWPRLIAQTSAGTAMALILIATDTMGFALGNTFLNAAVSIFWIVGITNPGVKPQALSLVIPIALLAIPILDTTVAVASRLFRGISPFTGGRDHLSHRLMRIGIHRKYAAITLWAASGVYGLLAYAIYQSENSIFAYIAGAGWVALLVFFLRIPSEDK